MSTMSISATTERPGTLRGRLRVVPWLTVVPLAVVLAYADGFWMISLRGAVGSIQRTGEPFVSWLRESALLLPVFVLAVLGALALAAHWFGPVLRKPRTVLATALLVVAAGTLVGIGALAASSAYDYHLQSAQLQLMELMRSTGSMGSMSMGSLEQQQQASLELQVRAVSDGSALLLATNLVLVGWAVALWGGRLDITTTRQQGLRRVS
jgi:glucan phosphoethanolaminetransferase (alkaline phosphatase superfamily)